MSSQSRHQDPGRQVLVEFVEVNLYQTSGKDLLPAFNIKVKHELWDNVGCFLKLVLELVNSC